MYSIDPLKEPDQRTRWLAFLFLLGFMVLAGRLWFVQVVSFKKYEGYREVQSYRMIREPAIRGKIFDRNGVALADNRPNYEVVLYLEELRPMFQETYRTARSQMGTLSVDERLRLAKLARYTVASNIWYQVTALVDQPMMLHKRNFERHYRNKPYVPVSIVQGLTREQVDRFVEKGAHIPGVDLSLQSLRYYPNGSAASHLLGYVRKMDPSKTETTTSFNYHLPDYEGRKGLEQIYDRVLRGQPGEKAVLINNLMYRQKEDIWSEAEPGDNLYLTLDLRIQEAAERALAAVGPNTIGAAIVMDVKNGDVLAMASAPTYDPNEFIGPITQARWAELNHDVYRPLINRASHGVYTPGSIFKLLVGMALLEEGGLDPEELYSSLGYYRLGPRSINDTAAPGEYDFRKALAKSSNSYFIHHGLGLGVGPLIDWGEQFFLGQEIGMLPSQESRGSFPSREVVRRGWHPGETANLCIGQGAIAVTPLQMAVMVAAVANGGTVFKPRIAARTEPQGPFADRSVKRYPEGIVRGRVNVSRRVIDIIHEGMLMDVEWEDGTGHSARVAGYSIGGKTGSAETDKRIDGRKIKDTWFASFAPVEDPQYAVVVLVVDGISGGDSCAPVARRIYEVLRDLPRPSGVSYRKPTHLELTQSYGSF